MKNSKSLMLARAGVIGALYVVATAIFAPVAFGPIQLRMSEAMVILPLIFPESFIGLTIGCFISNLLFSTPIDVALGTTATLIAGILTLIVGKTVKKTAPRLILGGLPPVILNAVFVPFTFMVASDTVWVYLYNMLTVGLSELLVVAIFGTALYFFTDKFFNKKQ